jgi:hypothetical protein
MAIQIINPIECPHWDDLLQTADRATFFHTTAWARVLVESYGYKPLYFTAMDQGRLAGLIPVMEIDSFLTGRRGVSLPFTDICHPIADTADTFQELMGHLTAYGNRAGWKSVELKGGGEFLDGALPCAGYFTHIVGLDRDEETINKSFRESTRRNIRNSEKAGVAVSFQYTREALAAFYRLHCGTRRFHGLPPQPWQFFEKIYRHIIAPEKGFVAQALHNREPVAGAVYFLFRDRAMYKFGASDKNGKHLRANNLVMWEAMRWLCRGGFRSLHFGRTEPWNRGLLQFKQGWRALAGQVSYYKFDLRKKAFSADGNTIKSSYPLFKIMPLPILRLTGDILYKHVG